MGYHELYGRIQPDHPPVTRMDWKRLLFSFDFRRGVVGPNEYGSDPLAKPARQIKYIIAEGMDVNFYATKEEAESSLEAIDVVDGVYTGYDADGRLLKILPRGQASEISLAEDEPAHVEPLRKLLIECLAGRGENPESTDLLSLLRMCERYLTRFSAI
jgi:hypothetical protein